MRHLNVYRRHFRPAVVASGVPEAMRFHDLRHSCAAILIHQGAQLLAVSRWLGHSGIAITADVYGHLYEESQDALTDRLDAVHRSSLNDRSSGSAVARIG